MSQPFKLHLLTWEVPVLDENGVPKKDEDDDPITITMPDFYLQFTVPHQAFVEAPEDPSVLLNRALSNLGWLPKGNDIAYLYVVKYPAYARYASQFGTVTLPENPMASAKEIAFADSVPCAAVKFVYELRSDRTLTQQPFTC
eukprot:gnl/Spiro4/8598_TR4504_c0_g1_i1.p1 gnl/Spiro4/8598_TR4504_c0_g1~~gnl/Spiro4/8598_TR4504_c0_g1_i1.p1  ORF type:complete len:142 (+),score=18.35 gnl/Spiro4/8598_TR4504_c0_g1_i1:245-670(+)